MGGCWIALTERYPPRDPVIESHPILVTQLFEERQTLLEPSAYNCLITLGNKKPQSGLLEGVGHASLVPQFPEHGQALLAQDLCPIIITLEIGQVGSSAERLRPHRSCHSLTVGQGPRKLGPPLTEETMDTPELPQGSPQPQGHLTARLCPAPFEEPS